MKFAIYAAITYLIGQQLAYTAHWPLLYALVTLPGTFFHECAHYFAALALDGHPHGFSIIPTWNGSSMESLGHVLVHPNWYNAATIGTAPLLLAPLTGLLIAIATRAKNVFKIVVTLWAAACSWAACIPSGPDLAIAASEPSSWPLAAAILGLITYATVRVVRHAL